MKTIKALAASVRGIDAIPVDYYVVFSEIEAQLCNEFDFVAEAAAMRRIHDALHTSAEGSPCASPVVTPLPVAGLVSKRVLVMDYLKGEPLSAKDMSLRTICTRAMAGNKRKNSFLA